MEKAKRLSARILLVFPAVLLSFLCAGMLAVQAKEVHLERGEEVYYEKYSTFYYYIDDRLSYCLEPEKASPHTGDFTADVLDRNQLLSKALYYVYGAPGYEAYLKPKIPEGWRSDADAYCLCHCILSYVYDGCSGSSDAFKGLSSQMQQAVIECTGYIRSFPDPVDPEIGFSKTSLVAYFSPEEKVQRTETVTCIGDVRNYIEMNLPEGVTLVNQTKGTKTQGKGKVWGSDVFYFCTDVALYNGQTWNSDKLYGAEQQDWRALIISTGAEGQHLGMGSLVSAGAAPVTLSVRWLPEPELAVDKAADKTGKTYKLGDVITYTMDVTQQIQAAVAKNVVITDTILTEGVKLQKNSIVLLDENQSIVPDAVITVKGNSYTIHAGEFLRDIDTGEKYTVEYQVVITDASVIGKEIENQVVVCADNAQEKEDREKVTVEDEPEEPEEQPQEPEAEEKVAEPQNPVPADTPDTEKTAPVKTGDEENAVPFTLLLILSCVVIITCVTMYAWQRAKDQ